MNSSIAPFCIDRLPCGLIEVSKKRDIINCNQYVATMLDISLDRLIGQRLESVMSAASRIFTDSYIYPLLLEESFAQELQIVLRSSEGKRIPVVVNITVEDDDVSLWTFMACENRDKLYEELLSTRDTLSENAQEMKLLHGKIQCDYEQERAMVAELARSNQELDNFAYVASHDLREPLRGIAINADLLMREEISESGMKRIERMIELTTRMETLISDLLFFSRLGRGDQSQEDIDPSEVIKSIERELLEMLERTRGTIRIETGLPLVHADKPKIKIIFQNLITNALKYNDADTKLVTIGFQESVKVNGKHLQNVFYVQDNGIGIDEQNHAKVFKIFTRLNREKDYGQGTGAGLSFVGKIIEEYGSKPTIASQLGQGATFYFSLPLIGQDQLAYLKKKG